MSLSLKIEMLILSCLILGIILYIVKKGRISIKYSLVWLTAGGILLIFAIFPNFLIFLSNSLGFLTASNFYVALFLIILILICISLTIIVSGQSNKIRLLIQEVSMLKEKENGGKK